MLPVHSRSDGATGPGRAGDYVRRVAKEGLGQGVHGSEVAGDAASRPVSATRWNKSTHTIVIVSMFSFLRYLWRLQTPAEIIAMAKPLLGMKA